MHNQNNPDVRQRATIGESARPDGTTALGRRSFLAGASLAAAGAMCSPSGWAQAAAEPLVDQELAWTPAWQLKALFANKSLSPLEYAHFLLERIERHQHLGAFISVFPEHLLSEARLATERIMKGEAPGLLAGLPVSVKDLIFTKGQRTTMGSKVLADHVPDEDAVAVERIRAAGGIVFAKSNTPEFGFANRTVNRLSRETANPWDTGRSAGGSSGGAAAASAAGLGPLAVGTDGGGSIRVPSALNGIFGLFPSRRRVPNGAGLWHSPFSGIGPMTRDVRDSALLMQVMAAVDHRDPLTLTTQPPDYLGQLDAGVKDLRMAWSADFGRVQNSDERVVALCHEAAKSFAGAGASYSEPTIRLQDPHDELEPNPEFDIAKITGQFLTEITGYKDIFSWLAALSAEDAAKLAIYVREGKNYANRLEYAMGIDPAIRYQEKTRLADLFKDVDLLMSPTVGGTAFPYTDAMSSWQYTAYTYLINLSGYCAASVPVGFVDGLPVGLQIIGRPDEEHLVLRAARVMERERPWADRRPQLLA